MLWNAAMQKSAKFSILHQQQICQFILLLYVKCKFLATFERLRWNIERSSRVVSSTEHFATGTFPWVKVPRNENPEIGRGSWGPPRPPCGSRAKPWWGTRGRSPRKLLDFSNLKPLKTAPKLWKFKTKLTKILLFWCLNHLLFFSFNY